jgi:phage shock protein E
VNKSYEELVAEAREATERVGVEEVHGALESGENVTIVDVREPYEWEAGHIPSARLIPRGTLEDLSAEELPDRGRRIVVHCNAGCRVPWRRSPSWRWATPTLPTWKAG